MTNAIPHLVYKCFVGATFGPQEFIRNLKHLSYSSFVILILQKIFVCPSGKLSTEFTSPMAKSTSPGLWDTTFFARWTLEFTVKQQTKNPNDKCLGETKFTVSSKTSHLMYEAEQNNLFFYLLCQLVFNLTISRTFSQNNSIATCYCHFAAFIEERARGLQFFINNILNHSGISKRYDK